MLTLTLSHDDMRLLLATVGQRVARIEVHFPESKWEELRHPQLESLEDKIRSVIDKEECHESDGSGSSVQR